VLAHHQPQTYDVFKFRRFRLNLISFLRLPLGVSENELRNVIKGCSASLHAGYVARAERANTEANTFSGGASQYLRQPSFEKLGDTDDTARHDMRHQNFESRSG
jgi:hypothetical protein